MYLSDEGSSDGFVGERCSANASQPCGRLARWIVAEVAAGWWRLGVGWWVGYWQKHTGLTSSGSIPTRAPLPSLNILLLLTATSSSLQHPTPPHCNILLLLTGRPYSSSLQDPTPPHCNILLLLTEHTTPPHCKTLLLTARPCISSLQDPTPHCNLQPRMCSHISSNMCSISSNMCNISSNRAWKTYGERKWLSTDQQLNRIFRSDFF